MAMEIFIIGQKFLPEHDPRGRQNFGPTTIGAIVEFPGCGERS
jgi:hypothetical protein